jgi:hypothetical protein
MSLPKIISQIKFPIKKVDIYPCSQKICLCLEYLNFGNPDHVNLYKHCMITNYNNSKYDSGYKFPYPKVFNINK